MKKAGYALLLAVVMFPLLAGCSANRKATSEILEERMRKPAGPLAVPGYGSRSGADKEAGSEAAPRGAGR